MRGSPIEGVLVTNADLDHTLGLFLLRGDQGVRIFAGREVWETLQAGLRLGEVISPYGGVTFTPATDEWSPLTRREGEPSGLRYRAISLPANPPRYAPDAPATGQSFAFEIEDERTGRRLLVAPDVAEVTAPLRSAMSAAHALLFDGTFWTDDELQRIDPTARTASQMGHLPMRDGSLPELRPLTNRRIYLHLNNTNPTLATDSPERREVERAGVAVGEDGMEFEV